jgi:osmotically-inducible protein OsmY
MEQVMNYSRKISTWLLCAGLGPAACGLCGFASPAADSALRARVESALQADPYFYDGHVTVSVQNGDVRLDGFVSSAWDLLDAMRIARKAAGSRRVIDNLSIELGGRK